MPKRIRYLSVLLLSSFTLYGCSSIGFGAQDTQTASVAKSMSAKKGMNDAFVMQLEKVVASRSVEDKARDQYRNPTETLKFFQVEPGMTVAEALPGGGWYSKILANYLGADGALYGVNYVDSMWARFGFFDAESIKGRIASTAKFPMQVTEFTQSGIASKGFTFNSVPADAIGKVDRVLFVRALHNLNRFESEAGTMTEALNAANQMLKSDGMIGVVQHRLPEAHTKNTDGSRGYLKYSDLVKAFDQAGFELVSSSEINANPKDQPSETDIVWRLPPSFNGSRDKPEAMAAMKAIGESNRMTLLFKKK